MEPRTGRRADWGSRGSGKAGRGPWAPGVRPLRVSSPPGRGAAEARALLGSGAGKKEATIIPGCFAWCLLIEGGGANGGGTLGAGGAFIKDGLINCCRGSYSTWERQSAAAGLGGGAGARPCAALRKIGLHPDLSAQPGPTPTPPPSRGLLLAPHPPALNFPGLPGRLEAVGGAGSRVGP